MKQAKHTPETGEEVYYTGDAANADGWGRCVQVERTKWGTRYTIELDAAHSTFDCGCTENEVGAYCLGARRFTVSAASFDPGPGRRFWRRVEWREHSARLLAEFSGRTYEEELDRLERSNEDARG